MQGQLWKSRELLQNPYAYLDGDGKFSAVEPQIQIEQKKRKHVDR
jgi:hypothetical protein